MNKKILGGIAVLAVAAVAAWNVSLGTKSTNLSDLLLANVEVLAYGENNDCPGKYCSFSDALGSCSACCPNGKTAVCNSFGCGCKS